MTTEFERVEGLADLERFLAQLPERVQVKIARNAMRAGSVVIRDEAKKLVPVKTRALKKSIRVGTSRARDGSITASIRAGDKVAFYAHMVEFGTSPHYIKAKGKALKINGSFVGSVQHPGARPKPFMRPALDARWKDAVKAVGERMAERLGELRSD